MKYFKKITSFEDLKKQYRNSVMCLCIVTSR